MRLIRNISFLILCLTALKGFGQVSVQFIPEVYGTSVNGLLNARLFSVAGRSTVRLNITVKEAKAGRVLLIQTNPFTLNPGQNILSAGLARNAKVTIVEIPVGNYLRRNQYLPQGAYEYEFVVISASSSEEIIVDQTFNHDVVPPAPLDLIEPFKDDQICEKRPLLTWQPSLPQIAGTQYQLLLVEIKERQNAVEALNYNLPIVNQKGIVANVLMYPPVSKELVTGKKYAWQVTAYKDETIINRSEVWAFKVDCKDSISNIITNDFGYRDIEDLVKGNYYVAEGEIKFAVVNSYQAQKLPYEIVCVTDPTNKIRSLPRLKLERGQNKLRIDLSHNFSFKDGYSYVLKIHLPNGSQKDLRFIFRDLK